MSQGLYLNRRQHEQNKLTQTSVPPVGFESMTPVFEWAKTVHISDRAATVIDLIAFYYRKFLFTSSTTPLSYFPHLTRLLIQNYFAHFHRYCKMCKITTSYIQLFTGRLGRFIPSLNVTVLESTSARLQPNFILGISISEKC
jgi:hypothetical protein